MTLVSGGRSDRRGDEDDGEEWRVRRGGRVVIFFYLVGNGWPVNYCGYFYVTQRTPIEQYLKNRNLRFVYINKATLD